MADNDRGDVNSDAVTSPVDGGVAAGSGSLDKTGINLRNLLDNDICSGMTTAALQEYERSVIRFGLALTRESSRLEEANRAEDVIKAEITTSMVVNANEVLRHPRIEELKTAVSLTLAQATSFALAIATPIIFVAVLNPAWRWTATVACGILAVAGQVYTIIKVRRK
jgi:hypothetical protein